MTPSIHKKSHCGSRQQPASFAQEIFIIAGEASGDMHAAGLCREILKKRPGITVTGVGGPAMEAAGVNLLFSSSRLAVVGVFEVLRHAAPIIQAFRSVIEWLKNHRPALLILVDYPDFNLLVASRAKRLGIPVFYYISPQLWAWREGRVKKIRTLVDRMAVILPFEKEFYKKHGVDVAYVGHPLLDSVRPVGNRNTFLNSAGISPESRLVGLLPGSRKGEIERFSGVMFEAARRVKEEMPETCFVIPVAPGISPETLELIEKALVDKIPEEWRPAFKLVHHCTHEAIAASDIILTASGTVTLEAGIIGTPMVVIYSVSPLTYHLGKHLIKVKYCSLVNLVTGREIVPEILQNEITPERLAYELVSRLKNPATLAETRKALKQLIPLLGGGGASERAASEALSLLEEAET